MNENELLELKEKIEAAKSKVSELKGRYEYLLKELKENHNCSTITEANEKIEAAELEITEINNDIDSKVTELEDKYNL